MFKSLILALFLLIFTGSADSRQKGEVTPIIQPKPQTQIQTNYYNRVYPDSVYEPVIIDIKKQYERQKLIYSKNNPSYSKFVYEIYPITLYPFTFLDSSVENFKKTTIYMDNGAYSAYQYRGEYGGEYVEIAVLSYATSGHGYIAKKSYKLHSYTYNSLTNIWTVSGKPIEVIFKAVNAKGEEYEPVSK